MAEAEFAGLMFHKYERLHCLRCTDIKGFLFRLMSYDFFFSVRVRQNLQVGKAAWELASLPSSWFRSHIMLLCEPEAMVFHLHEPRHISQSMGVMKHQLSTCCLTWNDDFFFNHLTPISSLGMLLATVINYWGLWPTQGLTVCVCVRGWVCSYGAWFLEKYDLTSMLTWPFCSVCRYSRKTDNLASV